MKKSLTTMTLAMFSLININNVTASTFTDALTKGKASADLRLRYEAVEQNNALKDATALTLRTRLGYTTADYKGFSGMIEMEDVRIVGGIDEYTVGPTGFNPGTYSVIADPESTELEQGFVKYKNNALSAKFGRQVLTLDNHRFIGHVGWRQDRQTFDGLSLSMSPAKDMSVKYAYLTKRNRIFAESADVYSKDHLLNASYKTAIGKLTGYAYLLETDNNTNNGLNTYGLRLSGNKITGAGKFLYNAEYATQDYESGVTTYDASYMFVEGGLAMKPITVKLGYEILGSDNSNYGFATPLATLHKFNGWTDQFLSTPGQGLEDIYFTISTKALGGKIVATYHDFSTDKSTSTVSDLGSEINLLYATKFNKIYNAGIKYATYSAGDSAAGKVDTDKLWIWTGFKF